MLLNTRLFAVGCGSLLLAATLLHAAPANDNFAARTLLPTTNTITITGDNSTATAEPGEPSARPNAAGKSVWWQWTPPADGSYLISTHGGTFDSVLAVYTGTDVASLTLVTDDDNGVSPLESSVGGDLVVLTNASAASSYKILVDGKLVGPTATSGGIMLSIRPNNDAFTNRLVLTGDAFEITSFNGKAGKEIDERNHVTGANIFGTPTPGKSLWWKWNAPTPGGFLVSTYPSTFPTVLAVYKVASTRQLSATLTLTNVPVAGEFLTVNGDTRTWAVAPTNTAKQITLGSTVTACATNLYQHVAAAGFTGPLTLAATANGIKLTVQPAGALAATASTNWATVTLATNFVQTNLNPQFNQVTKVATDTNTDWGGEQDFDSKGNLIAFGVTNTVDDYYFAVDGQLVVNAGVTNVQSGLVTLTLMPDNDYLANARPLTGQVVSVTGFNGRATVETGESAKTGRATQADPYNLAYEPQHSVWWKWQPLVNGPYIILTYGSPFNTFIGLLTNSANPPTISGLSWARAGAASADNGITPSDTTSLYALPDARTNQTYYIMTDSAYDENADFYGMIKLSIRPDNNSVSNRIVLTGTNAVSVSYNGHANADNFEKYPPTTERNVKTIWWSWTAPDYGVVMLDTFDSSFATVMAVYKGNLANFSDYQLVDWSSRAGPDGFRSELAIPTVPGQEYKIQVTGLADSEYGEAVLRLSFDPNLLPPGDYFASAQPIEGASVLATVTNTFASKESGEPNHAGSAGGRSIWWKWTAPGNGTVTITTVGSESYLPGTSGSLNTLLAVYTGTRITNLTQMAANDEDPIFGPNSTLTFSAVTGTVYYIAVDCGLGGDPLAVDYGVVTLSLEQVIVAPNDNFANRIQISGLPATVTGFNTNATKQAGEYVDTLFNGGASVWWFWRAPATGPVLISTEGSSFDTLLSVYSGTTLATNNLLLHNDAARPGLRYSRVTLNAVSNVVYNIAVEGQFEAQGSITLKIYPVMRLSGGSRDASGQFHLTFSSSPQYSYQVQYSTDLINWDTLDIITATGNQTTVVDADAVEDDHRFYRIIEE